MRRVSAVIPTWNRADLLRSVLGNLHTQTLRPDEVIVVDNGSTDESRGVAESFGARVIAFSENRGFAHAVNEGIRQARGEWLLILNNDVVLQPDWLERLLGSAEEREAAFAVGKLVRPDGSRSSETAFIDGSWDLVSRAAYAWRCGYGRHDGAVWSARRTISFAPMTAALFRRSVFEQVGLLETRFESYYEDVDFGIRCALAGVTGIYEPGAVAVHKSKTTMGPGSARVIYLTARNQIFILAKYYSWRTLRRFAWAILVGQVLAVMAAAKQGHIIAAIRGKLEALRHWSRFRREQGASNHDGNGARIEAAFRESEQEIHRLQRQIGFDPYWRLYFSLVRP